MTAGAGETIERSLPPAACFARRSGCKRCNAAAQRIGTRSRSQDDLENRELSIYRLRIAY
jgi:hypothetical protein